MPWVCLPAANAQAELDVTPELTFDLWVLSWDDISVDTGGALKTLLAEIGINLNVIIKDDDPMYEGIYQEPRAFTMYEMSHGYGSVPDHVQWRMHSENILDWGDNCYGLNNATVDTLLEAFLASTPATLAANAEAVQIAAKENIPYIPLFLSDDTHAIRAEWTNYSAKPGGVFTSFNPQTMIFMNSSTADTEFIMAYGSDLGELNPMFYRSERSHWYDMLVYDTLISYDEGLNPIPWLCESYDVSADGLEVEFEIRTGAQWHDGTALDADDVAFTFQYYKDAPEDAVAWSFMQHITDIAVAGNNVTVTLDAANAFALQTLGDLYILPEHIRDGIPADDARWDDATNVTAHTGSGPFMYDSRTVDEFTEMIRNDNWWGATNPNIGQIPNIETVRIDVVAGQDARILAMIDDEADTERYEVFGAYVQTILNAPELNLVTGVTSQWDYVLGFNMTIPGLDDLAVRTAISTAMDRDYLVNVGRLGFGTATSSVIPESFFPALYSEEGNFHTYNDTIANQILEDAGYIDIDNDGIREFPGAVAPAAGIDIVMVIIIASAALAIGIVVTFLILKKKG
ncbi:MAG: ABC transporter substrate-binding protein [Candidatus Thorarchaeota archaeon]